MDATSSLTNTETGVGVLSGDFTSGSSTWHAVMSTLGFARSGTAIFVTGVVYSDADHDAFYSMGEGRGGVGVTARVGGTPLSPLVPTGASGGYAMSVGSGTGVVDVVFSGGGLAAPVTVALSLAGLNAKLDLVNGATLRSSVDAVLKAGGRNLQLLGVADLDATGNAAANTLTGNSGANLLGGAGGDDRLQGGAGTDTLNGGAGADELNGGPGADRMSGGSGNDSYVVSEAADAVIEALTGGIDTLRSYVTRTLPANVENLVLVAGGALGATGNALGNELVGGTGNNALDGKAGNDTLTGGAGADRFTFSTAPGPGNLDQVTDFSPGLDRIVLDHVVFAAAGPAGVLAGAAFHAGASAQDASDLIVHDAATGALYYDADGSGAQAAVMFALLPVGLTLAAADVLVA